jgi:ABC-type multidrug transport system ATPase subunit/peptidoglycan/LPS O-acetylase OafA/YrhL
MEHIGRRSGWGAEMENDSKRLHSLDAVRAFALLLGIVLHGTMSFMPGLILVGWPIRDSSPSDALQVMFYVIHIFRMTTFFFIAGFFAHLTFHRRGAGAFAKDRARRILVPLVAGWVVLAPLTLATIVWGASRAGLPLTPPPGPTRWLAIPLMHLWFLYVLLLMYAVVLPVRSVFVSRLDSAGTLRTRLDGIVARLIGTPLAPVLLALPLFVTFLYHPGWIFFGGIPTPDQSLIPNLPAFIAFGVAFCFGWLVHRQPQLISGLGRQWWIHLVSSSVLTAIGFYLVGRLPAIETGPADPVLRSAYAIIYSVATWSWTFAFVGGAVRFLSGASKVVRYLSDSSYWLYLLHLPLVFALQVIVGPWPLHWSIKFPLLMAVTTTLLLLSYHYFVRSTFIGEILNGRRYPRSAAQAAALAAEAVVRPVGDVLASLHHAHKRYGKTVALDGLDLEVRRGELVAVLGPNGAGKTTAIALLLGLQQPDSGSALLFGEQPESLEARRRTGVMMQEVALAPELRVREHIELIASYYPAPHTVDAALEITHTTALARRPYGKLSGGQKRQVQFAMALCGRPELLFLDEPTVGLDVQARELMWDTIRSLVRSGCSVVLTTHYIEEAEMLADRVVVLTKGKEIASGTVNDMRALISGRRITCATRTPVEQIQTWPDVDSVVFERERLQITTNNAEAVVRRLLAEDENLSDLEVRRAGLSEAFTEITQDRN